MKKKKTKQNQKQNKTKKHTQNRETSLKTASWLIGFQSLDIGHLKQQRRRRLRKRHLKSEVALLQTLSRLFYLV